MYNKLINVSVSTKCKHFWSISIRYFCIQNTSSEYCGERAKRRVNLLVSAGGLFRAFCTATELCKKKNDYKGYVPVGETTRRHMPTKVVRRISTVFDVSFASSFDSERTFQPTKTTRVVSGFSSKRPILSNLFLRALVSDQSVNSPTFIPLKTSAGSIKNPCEMAAWAEV